MKIDRYETLILSLARELIGYLVKLGASPQDAEDIAQETIIKVLEADIILLGEQIRPWFYRVGINLYYNLYNRKKRYQEILDLHFSAEIESEFTADYRLLYAGLNQLSLNEANLLILKYEQKLSLKEISFLLNRPVASLKTELYRTRKKMRVWLEREEESDGI